MCAYLFIYLYIYTHTHNKYTQYTLIYYVTKTFILDAINCLTALQILFYYI